MEYIVCFKENYRRIPLLFSSDVSRTGLEDHRNTSIGTTTTNKTIVALRMSG